MSLGERAFKKAIRSKEHRERAQPERRAKLGLLEKKRDYVERARDYHRKEDRLKALRLRASQRNPDEFYFGMIRARQINGVHVKDFTEATKSLPADMLKLMKTQDVSYIALQKRANERKLKRLEEEIAGVDASKKGAASRSHIIFAEDETELDTIVQQRQTQRGGHDGAAGSNPSPGSGSEELNFEGMEDMMMAAQDILSHEFEDIEVGGNTLKAELFLAEEESPELRKKREELGIRRQRVEQLSKLEYKLNLDRQLLEKGRRKKIGQDEYGFAKYKWSVERKK